MFKIRPPAHVWILAALLLLSAPAWAEKSAVPEPEGRAEPPAADTSSEDWNAHYQITIVDQWHAPFNSVYQGANSLQSKYEQSPSLTSTLFLGKRLWEGAEFYLNPEVAGGYALSHAVGVAGFLNGEVTRISGNDPLPAFYVARGFLRQIWNLGEEKEAFASDQNALAGEASVSRLTMTLGKMSALDIFDNNAYSHDPRTQFLDWALMANGAWDYPADTRGYTLGATAEYNRRFWALRYGLFMVPKTPNGISFDQRVSKVHGQVVEGEWHYSLLGQPGKLRVLGFINQERSGSYREALNAAVPGVPVTVLRRDHIKYGFGLNAEQTLGDYLGGFLRLGWNDGKNETWMFTEIDQTASAGVALNGALWGRAGDKIGVAGVANGLSKDHRDFLAAGGYGFIIGDGALTHYAMEQIVETYYALPLALLRGLTLTLNYQHIDNPAYNADRGPVSIYSARIHYQF